MSDQSNTSESSAVVPVTADQEDYGYRPPVQQEGDEGEWEELKVSRDGPYTVTMRMRMRTRTPFSHHTTPIVV
jgi:hypothetical protein